jgi:hypothetical protein
LQAARLAAAIAELLSLGRPRDMPKRIWKTLLLLLALCAAAIATFFWLDGASQPRLSLAFLGYTNAAGRHSARFRVTNTGDATAVHYSNGTIENDGKRIPIGYRAQIHYLSPGQQDIIEITMPPTVEGRWRATCRYARKGLRSRLFDWVWSSKGPGPHANRFTPNSLKGVELDVPATSEWIDK